MALKDKTVVVGITGGIAAYKTCELVRELVKMDVCVHVILTEAARHFVTPLTLQTLSKNPVHVEMFAPVVPNAPASSCAPQAPVTHISLADSADFLIVAPASANIIAKVACGICDDLLTTTICATRADVIFAPSMNTNMWENKITQGNVKRLKEFGYRFVEPATGELACGHRGVGRLADIKSIIGALDR